MSGGLFDELDGPLELRQQTAAVPAERGELLVFPVLEKFNAGGGVLEWRQVYEVHARSLVDAGAVAAEVHGWPGVRWTWPHPAVLIGAKGRERFAVLDLRRATPADLPA